MGEGKAYRLVGGAWYIQAPSLLSADCRVPFLPWSSTRLMTHGFRLSAPVPGGSSTTVLPVLSQVLQGSLAWEEAMVCVGSFSEEEESTQVRYHAGKRTWMSSGGFRLSCEARR